MVGNLTVGRKKYADVQEEVVGLVAQSEQLRDQLLALIEADVRVFTQVMQAMKMPRATDKEKAVRIAAMEEALKAATEVPLKVAEACVAVMNLGQSVVEKGNVNALSDAGVAVLIAEAGLRGAALNVHINLGGIKDQAYVKDMQTKLDDLLESTAGLRDEVYEYVVGRL
jgi:formiminotetrahydrofolate cyclodeaminase